MTAVLLLQAHNVDVQTETVTTTVEMQEYSYTPVPKKMIQLKSTMVSNIELTDAEIDLLALVTMAEAEGESEEGQRLVIDTILNRVDHERLPDSVSGVIYQANQFTSMTNGRVDRCYVKDNIRQLVVEELRSRTNSDVVYFTAGAYGKYGTPLFSVGNHYFASY